MWGRRSNILRLIGYQEYVLWLYVSVHYARHMGGFKRAAHLPGDVDRRLNRQSASLGQVLGKINAL